MHGNFTLNVSASLTKARPVMCPHLALYVRRSGLVTRPSRTSLIIRSKHLAKFANLLLFDSCPPSRRPLDFCEVNSGTLPWRAHPFNLLAFPLSHTCTCTLRYCCLLCSSSEPDRHGHDLCECGEVLMSILLIQSASLLNYQTSRFWFTTATSPTHCRHRSIARIRGAASSISAASFRTARP